MNEQDLIEDARVRFMMETGLTPTKVYLGRRTHENLMKSIEPYLIYDATLPRDQRSSFKGLDIYKVDEIEYVAVGQ